MSTAMQNAAESGRVYFMPFQASLREAKTSAAIMRCSRVVLLALSCAKKA